MKVIPISELKEGQHFIWADDCTRRFMWCDIDPNHQQVLRLIRRRGDEIKFSWLDGRVTTFVFDPHHWAILIEDHRCPIPLDFRCQNCGMRAGDHYPGHDIRESGFHCNHFGSGQWFVPFDKDIKKYLGEEIDFFADLGL